MDEGGRGDGEVLRHWWGGFNGGLKLGKYGVRLSGDFPIQNLKKIFSNRSISKISPLISQGNSAASL